ncbi:MAG: rRNA pseudouridine synthase [Verrucomicrobia bacterium]|nr:rRNA pseudouridine synthase [Verrucomicrobiota bacterium]
MELIRLSKLMSERGLCSRREADAYIEAGEVLVDGKEISVLGTKVPKSAQISLKRRARTFQNSKVTILLNKPVGYVSTQPEKGYTPAIELIRPENQFGGKEKLQPHHLRELSVAGRLDIDSRGLLVLTQDGVIVKQIIGPEADLEKEYLVGVSGKITPQMIEKLCFGLALDDKPLKQAVVQEIEPNLLRFILREGKKRQIRRMCELVGLRVTKLKRVRVGRVMLGKLPEGKWRFLESHERF